MTDKVTSLLEHAGISYKILSHPPVFTVAESMHHLPESYPVKNLLLKEEKGERYIFVIMKGDQRLDTKYVGSSLNTKKLQFAKPEQLLEKLGVTPGSASLFSLLFKGSEVVEVVIDERLLDQKQIGFHPSENTSTIVISGDGIERFLRAINRGYTKLAL